MPKGAKDFQASMSSTARNISPSLGHEITAPGKWEKPGPLYTPNLVLSSQQEKEKQFCATVEQFSRVQDR